jgi:hypothetical protein
VGGMSEPKPTSARARVCKALGEQFAELLKERDSHQLGVCAKLGIPWWLHMECMAERAEPGTPVGDYQLAVLAALDDRRRADMDDMRDDVVNAPGTHVATIWNMRKHRHESRFRRFYDEPQKVELTGKDGGPIHHKHEAVAAMSDAQLEAYLAKKEGE